MQRRSDAESPDEQVSFVQNAIPGFEAGEYVLELGQSLIDSDGAPIGDAPIHAAYRFAVQGDRFSLSAPAQTVYTVFPPDASSGAYETSLPHVVLTATTLPWSRSPTTRPAEPSPQGDVPTWLTVLTLDDDDFEGSPEQPTAGVVGDLFPATVYPQSTLGDATSTFSNAVDTSALEPGQSLETPVQFVDVPLSLFWDIAPTLEDLELMAHVRKVSLLGKPTVAGVSDAGEPVGAFSIVFGNRMPRRGATSRALLVSLEALADLLPSSEDGGPHDAALDPSTPVRLVVLKAWSFRAEGQPATFVSRAQHLNESSGPTDTTFHLDYDGSNETVRAALEMGFVPMNTELRTAERTVSWYRGPLAPYAVNTAGPDLPLASPDAATSFDPTTGMFDMSYAAAWTLGRLIALQDTGFSVPLYQWRKTLKRSVASSIETQLLSESLDRVGVPDHDGDGLDGVLHRMMGSLVRGRP